MQIKVPPSKIGRKQSGIRHEDEELALMRCAGQKTFPLLLASQGECVRIARLDGGRGLALRLTELGLNVGSVVRIAQSPGNQKVVIRGEARLALGCGIARRIQVTIVDNSDDGRVDR